MSHEQEQSKVTCRGVSEDNALVIIGGSSSSSMDEAADRVRHHQRPNFLWSQSTLLSFLYRVVLAVRSNDFDGRLGIPL